MEKLDEMLLFTLQFYRLKMEILENSIESFFQHTYFLLNIYGNDDTWLMAFENIQIVVLRPNPFEWSGEIQHLKGYFSFSGQDLQPKNIDFKLFHWLDILLA